MEHRPVPIKIKKTIPGNTNLQIDNNTGRGANLLIVPIYGTDFTNDDLVQRSSIT